MKKIATYIAAFAVLGTATALADARSDRQAVMQSNRTASAGINEIVVGIMDPAAAKAHAQTLIDNGARTATLFAPGTDQNDAGAQPAIWTDAAGFKAANDKFIANARKVLAAIPDRVNMAVAMRELQTDCGACHKAYRVMPAATPAAGRGGRGAAEATPAPTAPAQ